MDMDMDMDMGSSTMTSMKMYFHGSRTDLLWFKSWAPLSPGAFAGACIGLFVIGLLDRFICAVRGVAEVRWRRATQDVYDQQSVTSPSLSLPGPKCDGVQSTTSSTDLNGSVLFSPLATLRSASTGNRLVPPFIWRIDVMRGLLKAFQFAIHYVLMLAVMTFNAYFFLCIILGEGVGEVMFGRFASDHH